MLSYTTEEAETLLEGKLSGAQQTLANCEEDLDFLREQITASDIDRQPRGSVADNLLDARGSDCASLQLGRDNEAKGEG